MWLLLKGLALRFAVGRTIGGLFAALLLFLVPVAGVLKIVGLPLLIVLGVVGAPVFLLLAAIGLPVLLVLGIGGMLLFCIGIVLALSVMAIKIILPIVLVVWVLRWIFGKRRRPPASEAPAPDVAPDAAYE
jgi:hypothetical protein